MRLFKRYFGHVDEAIVILDQASKNIVFLNMEAEDLFDVDWKDISGRPFGEYVETEVELDTCDILKPYSANIVKNNMKINLQCFNFMCDTGAFIGCIVNAKQLLPIKELLMTNKYPIGVVKHKNEVLSWENYNKAFEAILGLQNEDDPLNYLNHQFTLEKKDSWSGTTSVRYEQTMQTFEVKWFDIDEDYRIIFMEASASLAEKVNLLEQFQKHLEESSLDIDVGRIIRIDFFLNHTNNKLLMDFIEVVRYILGNYGKSIHAKSLGIQFSKSLNIFTDCKDKDLIELPNMILKSPEIERLEYKNNCNLNIRISVSEAQALSLEIVHQAFELMNLFESDEYNDIYFYSQCDVYKEN